MQSLQARAMGIDAVLLGSDGWLVDGLAMHRDLEGAYFSQGWHRDVARFSTASEEFIARYENAYGRQPDEPAALTYDAFGLLFEALGNASQPEPRAIRDALSVIEGYPGLTGPITFRDRGGDPRKNAVIVRIEQGELRLFKVVEPSQED